MLFNVKSSSFLRYFEIFTFLSSLFGYVVKQVDKKAMVSLKIWDITNWINNYNRHNFHNQAMKFDQLIKPCLKNLQES